MPKLENWKFFVKQHGFKFVQSLGFHFVTNHFYEPIPDTRTLSPLLWSKRVDLPGVDFNDTTQLDLLLTFTREYSLEYNKLPRERGTNPKQFFLNNSSFNRVDAEAYYCFLRHFKPRKVVEIGSGMSTLLASVALKANRLQDSSYSCEYTVIDPYPSKLLKSGIEGVTNIHSKPVQQVPLSEFGRLQAGDILFIDSSHVLKIGSDVQFEFLEILPRLNPGVMIHVHDVFLPAEYPRDWVMKEFRFWSEQYILQAMLTQSRTYEILFAASYLHLKYPGKLTEAFASYDHKVYWPGSFWMRKRASF